MISKPVRGFRQFGRWLTLAVAGVVAFTLVGQSPALAAAKEWKPPVPTDVKGVPVRDWVPAAAAGAGWQVESRTVRGPRTVVWPAAGVSAVDLSTPAARSGGWVAAGPVRLARPDPIDQPGAARSGLGPDRVEVNVLDRQATARAGVSGVVMTVGRGDGHAVASAARLEMNYTGFGNAYGGDWASRLRLVRLPSCVLSTPQLAECQRVSRLEGSNNVGAGTVSALVPLSGGGATVIAVLAGSSGDNGDYTATSLSPAGTWQVSQQSGDFSWSLPLRMPPSLDGPAPSVSVGYSSGSIDGRTGTSNNQGGWIGDGWDFWPGFIERGYASCTDDNPGHKTGDQCWFNDNATLSLSGHAGELIQAGGVWRLKNDDGTRVEKLTDAARANGDNDNEYWKVTTSDGAQYFFGYHRLPGWVSGNPVTNSTWTVPVFGNNTGEPCFNALFGSAHCAQAWRWNLDYVVDPHGNSMAMFYGKETGAYGRDLTASLRTTYDRGGWLDRIDYGMRSGAEYAQAAPLRVVFGTAERCLAGCWSGAAWTSNPVESAWPDTPWDQYCAAAPCTDKLSPTFWSARRLTTVTTQIRNGTASYANVESWALRHEFINAGVNEGTPMWLRGITRTGYVTTAGGVAVSDPEITFDPGANPLANRVDGPDDGRTFLYRWRIKQIATESGGMILVTYSDPECSKYSGAIPVPHSNTMRCMPAFYAPPESGEPTLDWFHKYVVTRVDLDDMVTDQPTQSIFYDYLDSPAWAYNTDEITKDKFRTWGDWRGFGRVQVRQGDPTNSVQTAAEYRYLRGMDGDKQPVGVRDVHVGDSWGGSIEDHEALQGFQLQQITLNGPGGAEVSSTRNEPWRHGPTATRTRNGVTTNAWKVETGTTRTRTALAAGGFRSTKTTTGFDTEGLPVTVDNFGDETATGDETCTRTTYARNTAAWIMEMVSQVETLSGTCAAAITPAAPATVLNRSRIFYDGYVDESSFGAAPTKGEVVRTEELDSFSGGITPVYVRTSTNDYDDNGRIISVTDPRGHTTTTGYTTVHGGLVSQTTVINPLGHATTTVKEPAWDLATRITDPNNVRTDLTYDGLGRLTKVWLPGRPMTAFATTPSLKFSYLVRKSGGPTAVTTETLVPSGSAYHKSITLMDGFLRTRQVQDQSPGGGRTLTDTRYNTVGQVEWESAAYYDETNAAVSTTLGSPSGQVAAITEHVYDGAERETVTIFKNLGIEDWRATTSYDGDRVHVTPPVGGTATTTVSDARGRTVELRQYKTFADVGSSDPTRYVATTYAHTLLDQRKTVVDQLGNTWSYSYDLRGRQTTAVDPDKGITTTTYDAAGNVVTNRSSLGTGNATLAYTYDELGRKTTMRDNTVTGTIRAQWAYDTVTNGKGKLVSATRFLSGNPYINRVNAYDIYSRPTSTSLVLPATESTLCAAPAPNTCTYTYTTTTIYKTTSHVSSATVPAAADLSSEELVYGYTTDVGNPYSLISTQAVYVDKTIYSKLNQVIGRTLGRISLGQQVAATYDYDEPTRRLVGANIVPNGKPEAVAYSYAYDDAGNVIRVSEVAAGQTADHQCFVYDYLRRLTEAWTPTSVNCSTAPTYSGLGGPAKYWHQWTFDAIGNRLTEKRKVSTGDTTYTYTHPVSGAGSVRPHTVSNVTASGAAVWSRDYTYDNGGNTKTRPTATGGTQALTFNSEGKLNTLVEGTATTTFNYDADGSRMIRRDPGGSKTLYLPDGTEVRYDQSTNTKKATRYYSHNGTTIAVRTAAGLQWLVADHHGTAECVIDAATLAVTSKRRMLPYGEQRGAAGTWPAAMDKGFVGGTKDPTGLTHLGARLYDPFVGAFISVDPIIDFNDPQQIHGYSYANNNPTTGSDPDGRCVRMEDMSAPCVGSPNYQQRQEKHERQQRTRKSGRCGGSMTASAAERCAGHQRNEDLLQRLNRLAQKHLISIFFSPVRGALSACGSIGVDRCDEIGYGQLAWCHEYGATACFEAAVAAASAARHADAFERSLKDKLDPLAVGRANAFQHAYWMGLLITEYGFSSEQALLLGIAHEVDNPKVDHHYGHWNSDVDLQNNQSGVAIAFSLQSKFLTYVDPSGALHVQEVAPAHQIFGAVTRATDPGRCIVCLDLAGY